MCVYTRPPSQAGDEGGQDQGQRGQPQQGQRAGQQGVHRDLCVLCGRDVQRRWGHGEIDDDGQSEEYP